MSGRARQFVLASSVLLVACTGNPLRSDAGAPAEDAGVTFTDGGAAPPLDGRVTLPDAASPPGTDGGSTADAGITTISTGACADPVPPGAAEPAPLPVYAGTCPTLVPGHNHITSSGEERELLLVVPAGLGPSERLPVIFMWHWLGGSADAFAERGEVQAAVDALRFIAVVPEEKGDMPTRWPFLVSPAVSDARVDEELAFFDDMLACVAAQYEINPQCVSSAGVSAGALWNAQLAQERSTHLSSILSFSGGVGTGSIFQPVRGWRGAAHAMPALVLWGGPTDFCGIDFNGASHALEAGLSADGHFLVECVHNCAHTQPPLERSTSWSIFAPLWRFALDHPYWLPEGTSPWQETGMPEGTPTWCAFGAGAATPRSGACESGFLGDCN